MSVIKYEAPQPIRHFTIHEDPLTHIETLHLVLWDRGLCIGGYSKEGKVLTAKAYSFSKGDIAAIEAIFINEPMVAGPQPVTHIWVSDTRQLLIPRPLYQAEDAALWLKKLHFIEATEHVKATPVASGLDAVVVYPIAGALELLLQKYFPDGAVESLSAILLCQQPAASNAYADIVLLDQTALLSFYLGGKLLAHQVIAQAPARDLVYLIAALCREHGVAQEDIAVHCSGLCLDDATLPELQAFFPEMIFEAAASDILFTLLNRQLACAS